MGSGHLILQLNVLSWTSIDTTTVATGLPGLFSQCFDLLYGETLRRCQDFGLDRISFQESGSGLERISYLINFLMKFPRKRKA